MTNKPDRLYQFLLLTIPTAGAYLTGNKTFFLIVALLTLGIPGSIAASILLFRALVQIPRTPTDYEG
jgi:putative effector of murein hydrolase LrgA (UPF0299 family)